MWLYQPDSELGPCLLDLDAGRIIFTNEQKGVHYLWLANPAVSQDRELITFSPDRAAVQQAFTLLVEEYRAKGLVEDY